MPFVSQTGTQNDLLNSMSEADRSAILGTSTRIECTRLEVLQRPEEEIGSVYFPETGWVSFLAVLENGHSTEVGVVGREGMAGVQVVLGGARASFEWVVQGPGSFLRMDVVDFRRVLEQKPNVKDVLSRFAVSFHDQVAQTAACNVSHTVEQRLARWLLLSHDRNGSDKLKLTQDILSVMLGVRRAGVTVAANHLKALRCIDYSRGSVTITDRARLEVAACECYRAVQRRYERQHG